MDRRASRNVLWKLSVFNLCDPCSVQPWPPTNRPSTHVGQTEPTAWARTGGRQADSLERGLIQRPHSGHRGEVTGPRVRGGPTRLWHSAPQGQVSGWHQMKILRHSQGLGLGTTCKFQLAMPSHRESEPSRILGRTPCCPACLSTAKGSPEPGRGGQRMGCRPQATAHLPSFRLFSWTEKAFLPWLPCIFTGKETAPLRRLGPKTSDV